MGRPGRQREDRRDVVADPAVPVPAGADRRHHVVPHGLLVLRRPAGSAMEEAGVQRVHPPARSRRGACRPASCAAGGRRRPVGQQPAQTLGLLAVQLDDGVEETVAVGRDVHRGDPERADQLRNTTSPARRAELSPGQPCAARGRPAAGISSSRLRAGARDGRGGVLAGSAPAISLARADSVPARRSEGPIAGACAPAGCLNQVHGPQDRRRGPLQRVTDGSAQLVHRHVAVTRVAGLRQRHGDGVEPELVGQGHGGAVSRAQGRQVDRPVAPR